MITPREAIQYYDSEILRLNEAIERVSNEDFRLLDLEQYADLMDELYAELDKIECLREVYYKLYKRNKMYEQD